MNEAVTITALASGPGAWFVTSGILIKLKAQFGPYWSDWANRITGFILPLVFVEVACYASQAATGGKHDWILYFLAAINGLLAGDASTSNRNIFQTLTGTSTESK